MKGPLPTTDPIPRQPEPTGLRTAHREEAALPVDIEPMCSSLARLVAAV
jgi:hypothetical protein